MMIRAAARRSSGFRSSACDSTRFWIVFVAVVVGVFACCLLPQARGADVNLDDAATAETNDEVTRFVLLFVCLSLCHVRIQRRSRQVCLTVCLSVCLPRAKPTTKSPGLSYCLSVCVSATAKTNDEVARSVLHIFLPVCLSMSPFLSVWT